MTIVSNTPFYEFEEFVIDIYSSRKHVDKEITVRTDQDSRLRRSVTFDTSHAKGKRIKLSESSPGLVQLSGYDTDDEHVDSEYRPIFRSFTVGSKGISNHQALFHTWKFLANNHDTYPDMTNASKEPPLLRNHEIRIPNRVGNIHSLATSGSLIVIGVYLYGLHMYNIEKSNFKQTPSVYRVDDEIILSTSSTSTSNSKLERLDIDTIRSLCFPLDRDVVWAGTEKGFVFTFNKHTGQVSSKRTDTYGHPITFILRNNHSEMWVLDQAGNLEIQPTLTLAGTMSEIHKVIPNARTTVLSKQFLWLSPGDFVYRFDRSSASQSTVLAKDVIQLFLIPHFPNLIFSVQSDGEISSWDEHSLEKKHNMKIAHEKCRSVCSVGSFYLWMGFQNGMIVIYDTRPEPWVAVKVWKAHRNPVVKITWDVYSVTDTLPVISMDSSGNIAVWDGLLGQHWLEEQVLIRTNEYCKQSNLNVAICSWNLDAIKPDALTESDTKKIQDWLSGMEDADIISIGIQEIADLSSKALTAKSILALNRKIETIEEANELLTHRYMLWYNYLKTLINNKFGTGIYHVIKTDQLVGLFSCVFVKYTIAYRIKQCDSSAVKTGFRFLNKSLHGNKGGIAIRLVIDDSSICFVNCHLAAGQKNVAARNTDIEGIVHSARFPTYTTDRWLQQTTFRKDAEGTNVLDHETCFLSGDLNYRINLDREQVLDLLEESENKLEAWESLQLADQLKQQQAENPMFHLIGFKEAPILFDPTYKYDKGTDVYDSSEKKRVPSWCDRILYRGPNMLTNLFYRRHEVLASDHRPISAGFSLVTKVIDYRKLMKVEAAMKAEWRKNLQNHLQRNKVNHILYYGLCGEKEATKRLESRDWDVDQVALDLIRDKVPCFL